jgi:2-keto-4-pentenoate hydratase
MNPTDAATAAASALRQARLQRIPVPPVSAAFGLSSLADAYRVAELNTAARVAEGRRIVGKKIGLTAKAVQQQLGVDQPDFGVLFDDMEFLDGAEIPCERLIQPKIEAEVAFVVARDIDGEAPTYAEFLNGLAYALPALEIVDSAITDWKITLFDTVADNASSGLYVLGDQPVAVGALPLGDLGMAMARGGEPVSVGTGAACLGHPLRAAYWLARTMAAQGQGLKAGEVILSGALGPMVPVQAGDVIEARIAALGRVACRMA